MIRRGIVVVHGVGEQRKADQLDLVVEPLIGFLSRSLGQGNVHLVARTHRDGSSTASATIHLTPEGATEPLEEWHVREAWWANCFRPSNSATVLGWAVRALFFHIASTAHNVLLRNLLRVVGRPPPVQGVGVWAVPGAGRLRALLDALAWLVITLGYLLVYVLSVLLVVPVYVFLLMPAQLLWPAGAARVQRAIVNLLTGGIGDQQAMTDRRVAVAAAANVVDTALYPFLAPDGMRGRTYDTVTVIAHSGGCVVSYEALAEETVARWLRAGPPDRRITWVTVGSGLNLAWRMRAQHKAVDQAFWRRRIDRHVNWIDIYARYDPVPQGEAPGAMVTALAGPPPQPYVSVRVANGDFPLSDHFAYWWNREEVLSRIVHAISDSRLGRRPLDAADGSYAPHLLAPAVRRAVEAADGRRRAVTRIQMLRLGLPALGLLLLWLWRHPVERLGERLVDGRVDVSGWPWLPGPLRRWLTEHAPEQVGWLGIADLRAWLIGAAALLYVALVVALVLRLMLQLASWWRTEADDPPPPEMGAAGGAPAVTIVADGSFACPPGSYATDAEAAGEGRLDIALRADDTPATGRMRLIIPGRLQDGRRLPRRFKTAVVGDGLHAGSGIAVKPDETSLSGVLLEADGSAHAFSLRLRRNGAWTVDLSVSKGSSPDGEPEFRVVGARLDAVVESEGPAP